MSSSIGVRSGPTWWYAAIGPSSSRSQCMAGTSGTVPLSSSAAVATWVTDSATVASPSPRGA
jgi:hypothetical protein